MAHRPLPATWADPRRAATAADHLSLLLFGLLNPVLQGLRALSAASGLARVQREVCGARISRRSLSEAQHLLEPALLARVFTELSARRAAGVVRDRWVMRGAPSSPLLPARP